MTAAPPAAAPVLVKGGTVVLPGQVTQADILIENGIITRLGTALDGDGARVEDVTGLIVLPGAIDPHVHFGWPGAADDFEGGSIAAACGGVTTVIEYAVQFPGDELSSSVDRWEQMGTKSVVDFGLHAIVSDARPGTLESVAELVSKGICSFKMFMTSQHSGGLGIDDGTMFQIMSSAAAAGGMTMAHCENDSLIGKLGSRLMDEGTTGPLGHSRSRPPFVEAEAVQRAVYLAVQAGCPFYVPHLSSAHALGVVREAQAKGWMVLAETCPQFLTLTDSVYSREHGEWFVMSPPIKSQQDQEALWGGLLDGSLVTVGSDHCPYPADLKQAHAADDFRLIPNGVPGVETLLALMYGCGVVSSGRLSLDQLATITAANPAKVFGMSDRKGAIALGKDADLVVIDPARGLDLTPANLHSRIDYSIFADLRVAGRPVLTIARGEVIARDGEFVGSPGRARLIRRHRPDKSHFRRAAL